MSMKNGGPAFPTSDSQAAHTMAAAAVMGVADPAERDRIYTETRAQAQQGMTLRDHFAGLALFGIVNGEGVRACLHSATRNQVDPAIVAATVAYNYADAMLVVREQPAKPKAPAQEQHTAALSELLIVAHDFDEVLTEKGLHCECGEADCRTTRLRAAIAKATGRVA